jgi:hypothetical protein
MTSPFNSSTKLLFEWSVDNFCLSLSIQNLMHIFLLAINCNWAEILGFLGILGSSHQRDLRKDTFCQIASFEPSCVFVRRSVRPVRDSERKKLHLKKKPCIYFTYMWGAPFLTGGNGSFYIFYGSQRHAACQFWWLYMNFVKGFDLCEGPIFDFSNKKLYGPYSSALHYRAGM